MDAARDWLDPHSARMSELLPELGESGPAAPQFGRDPAQAEFELLDSVARFLFRAARDNPLLLVLEDLHWADHSTLGLLRHLASDLSRHHILIVGTYRDVELSRAHPLADALGELQRSPGFTRLPVRALDGNAVAYLVNSALGVEQTTETIGSIAETTSGNPLFVLEMARELATGEFDLESGRVPEGIREALGRRLNRVSERSLEMLQYAALAGRQFNLRLLQAVIAGWAQAELLDALEEAAQLGIVTEDAARPGQYTFGHALIQQTIASEISVTRQARHHARIAEALEILLGKTADQHAAELAHHFIRAEAILGPEKALRYSILAGQQAVE
ncbi:MAG TPA: AAA family ATPase, partial [Burkholderiaceae bacterium]|nr:AAA family ATPase [Burkholderiaceae bacterium]